jgi:hypothetical protein
MSRYFQIHNFERVSTRRELRLSPRLLNEPRYISMPDNAKALLIGCMLLAARCGNMLPYEPLTLARRTGVDPHYGDQADGAITQLEQSGFIEANSGAPAREQVPQAAPLGQRQSTSAPAGWRPLPKMRFDARAGGRPRWRRRLQQPPDAVPAL